MNCLARAILAACARAGVVEYVVCAGARNAALAMPLAAISENPECPVRVWNFFDERGAGFFALGRARALRRPVAIVTTSGTAAAELLPAAVEAWYQQVPIVMVTADRPKRFRGTGAPQAIEQAGIFSAYVGHAVDLDSEDEAGACLDSWNGLWPAHLNVCLPEPTSSDCAAPEHADVVKPVHRPEIAEEVGLPSALQSFLENSENLVVLLGSYQGEDPSLVRFLLKLSAPIFADAASGHRESDQLRHLIVHGGDRAAEKMVIGSVLRIGEVPVWRLWRDLEAQPEVPVFSVTNTGFSGLARSSTVMRTIRWDAIEPPSYHGGTGSCGEALGRLLRAHPHSECGWVHWLSRVISDDALVFLGNSLPVREWNLAASTEDRGLRCFTNRGANGIDGILTTALGLGANEHECWIVVGDLTTLYDLSAPWVLDQIACTKVRIAVINNGGGQIFSRLPSLHNLSAAQRQVMGNSHAIRFENWAAMWGMRYLRVSERCPLALEDTPYVIEIEPNLEATQAFWNEWGRC